MGCLFGYYGKNKNKAAKFAESLDIKKLYTLRKNKLFIVFGGIPETCIVNDNKESGWAVLGLGILLKDNYSKIMDKKEWEKVLNEEDRLNKKINGHYILVKWKNNNISFISDPLGVRNLYYSDEKAEKIFSTRLDWITKFKKNCSIDFETFGSSWLTYNNLSYNPIIKDVKSTGPGGKISVTDEKLKASREEWLPSFKNYDFLELEKRLNSILKPKPFEDKIFTFGLSGGFDSRTLLSILFPVTLLEYSNIQTHTFGDKENLDVKIAKKITKDLTIPNNYLKEELIYDEKYISNLHSYISQNNIIEPGSSYLKLIYFSHEYFKNKVLIDGANGEIGRRKFLNRLVKFGHKGLKESNPDLIYKYIEISRGHIFRDKYMEKMKKGTLAQIEKLLIRLPSAKDIGVDNLADLFATKTRSPNYSGVEQARLDNMMVSYVPFLQKDIIDPIFSMNLYWRENGRYFSRIIKKFRPELTKYPLVKGNSKIPFFLSSSTASAYVKLKGKLFPSYKNDCRTKFYRNIKEYVLKTLDSNDFKNFSPYNHKKIKNIVKNFYSGSSNNINTLDWWYTFEIWRKELGIG
jgi:hypothetical protein